MVVELTVTHLRKSPRVMSGAKRLTSNSKVTSFQQGGTPQTRVSTITTTPWMDLSTSAQPSGCICPPAREPHDPVDAFIHPQPSAPTPWIKLGKEGTRPDEAAARDDPSQC